MRNHRVENLKYGIINTLEPESTPAGSASRSLNWLTLGDHIELRRGYQRIGGDDGVGKLSSIHVAPNHFSVETLFKTYARKIKYLDSAVDPNVFVEMGSNSIPVAASGEDVWWDNIKTLAGTQAWLCSVNGILFKVMMNHGDSAVVPTLADQTHTTNFTGRIKIKRNRIYLFGRKTDPSGFNGSYIDARSYTTVTAEVIGTGNGSTKTFTNTLTFKAGGSRRTCFGITVTDGTESFTDNKDGTLTGSAGGTGTINYATGAISVTFFANVTNLTNVACTYQWEDSAVLGIADFHESGTRVAGQGFYLPQGEGGDLQLVLSYRDVDYCIHRTTVYRVELTNDDTNATNEVYRLRTGTINARAGVATGEGVYYVDSRDQSGTEIRLLTFSAQNAEVIPVSISLNIDLDDFVFDGAAMYEWEDYIIVACRTADSVDSDDEPINNRMLLYHRTWKSWDVVDLAVTHLATYNGSLTGAHSYSNNALELFSGFDDDGSSYDNYWESDLDEQKIEELKKSKEVWIKGLIDSDQNIDVYLAIDGGDFVLLGSISGTGSYVNSGVSVSVGRTTIGKRVVGGSNDEDEITAHPYQRKLPVRRLVGKYQRAKIKFVATELGYASVSEYDFKDIETFGNRVPARYSN
jgi:hypothetical protein